MTDHNNRPSYGNDQPGYGNDQPGYGQGPYGAAPQGQGQPQGRPDYGPTGQGPYGQGPQGDYGSGYAQGQGYGTQGAYGQGPQGGYGQGPQGGWDQQSGSRYGTLPYEAYGQQRLEEPPKYRHLLLATLVSLGLYVVSAVPGFMMFGNTDDIRAAIDEQMAAQGQTMTAEETRAVEQMMQFMTGAGVVMTVLFTLIFVGLYLLVYFGLRKRRNWARITGIVFAILSVVVTVPGLLLTPLMGGSGMFFILVSVLSLAVNIWWLVLAFNGRIARYLQQRSLMG